MDAIRAIFVFEGKSYDAVSLSASGLQVDCADGFAAETVRKMRGAGFTFTLRDAATGNEAELIGELARVERDERLPGGQDGGKVVSLWINFPDSLKDANGQEKTAKSWPLTLDRPFGAGARSGAVGSLDVGRGRAGRTIAVGGGKGGVGKTIVAVNICLAMSLMGKNVVLLDGDIGNCNCNTLLGITRVESSLEDYLRRARSLEEVTVSTVYSGLRLVCGAQNKVDDLLAAEMARLMDDVRHIEADALVIDLGAGMSDETLSLYRLAEDKIIVATPQVTSLQNAYGFVKSAFFHDLKCTGGFDTLLDQAGSDPQMLYTLVGKLEEGHEVRHAFAVVQDRQRFQIVGNMMNDYKDMRIIQNLQKVVGQYLHIDNIILGTMTNSEDVRNSVNRITPFLALYPNLPLSRDMKRMALRLLQNAAAGAT